MDKDQLRAAGESLFGRRRWQTALAHRLGVTPRTVRRWAVSRRPVPGPAAAAIQGLLEKREKQGGQAAEAASSAGL